MKTSRQGIGFLERHEGVVLRAYRCPAGVWTIGAGLTAASGVVAPHAGMVIAPHEASRLLALALERNYEPAVRAAMPGAAQHAFDAGVSFHFNTGAIGRASWVGAWIAGDWPAVRRALASWNKGGGQVLPGLVRRREEEFRLLEAGDYGVAAPAGPAAQGPVASQGAVARIAAPVTAAQAPAIMAGLETLGYEARHVQGIAAAAVRAFQRDHGLTVDAIVGRATASTLQRVLDARARLPLPVAAALAGVAEAVPGTGLIETASGVPFLGETALGLAALRLLTLAFGYRDALAAALAPALPRIAAFLRSF